MVSRPWNQGDARDVANVKLRIGDGGDPSAPEMEFPVYFYLAHVVTPESLMPNYSDSEDDDEDEDNVDTKKEEQRGEENTCSGSNDKDAATEDVLKAFMADGSFTGTLLWDAAIHASEHVLRTKEWAERLRGASIIELGCGVGLLGKGD
jgi:hypothetical protein